MSADQWGSAVFQLAGRLLDIEARVLDIVTEAEKMPVVGGVFLPAGRPYLNMRELRRLVASVSGRIYWLDQFADVQVLDTIAESRSPERHKSFTVIRQGNPEERLVRLATSLRLELAQTSMDFDFRLLSPQDFPAHARWFLSDEGAWTLPSASALRKADEIRPSSDPDKVRSVILSAFGQSHSLFGEGLSSSD